MGSFNLGSFLQGGAGGYAFVKGQKRKNKEDERLAITYGREDKTYAEGEALKAQVSGLDTPGIASQGVTPPTPDAGMQAQAPSAAQGVTQPQAAQAPVKSWDERAKELLDVEAKVAMSPDGGAKFKPTLEQHRKRLLMEDMSGFKFEKDDGTISQADANRYAKQFRETSTKLGVVVTPEMIEKAAGLAKTLEQENVSKGIKAFDEGDIETANKFGATGNMRWNLSNPRQIKLPNGATVWEADNTLPDGRVVKINSWDAKKRELDIAAGLKFALDEQKGMTDQTKANTEARDASAGGKPTDLMQNVAFIKQSIPGIDEREAISIAQGKSDTFSSTADMLGGGTLTNKTTGETWAFDRSGKQTAHSPPKQTMRSPAAGGVTPPPAKVPQRPLSAF